MSHILIPSEGLERAYLYLTRNDIPTSITLKLNWQSEPHSVSASLGLNSHCGKFCSRSANLPPLASQRLTGMPHCGSHQAPNAPHPHKHLLVQNEMAPPWICTHVVTTSKHVSVYRCGLLIQIQNPIQQYGHARIQVSGSF
jgi:hypothetical protein